MSSVIDMEDDPQNNNPEKLKKTIITFFRTSHINGRQERSEDQRILMFIVKASADTYRLATLWKFQFFNLYTRIQIFFYNCQRSDFLRAYTDRVRIQTSILIRWVNTRTMPYNVFTIDTQSGILKMHSSFDWGPLNYSSSKFQKIQSIIMKLFGQIRKYDELMLFVQPTFNMKQNHQLEPNQKINKLRIFLKRNKNNRNQIHALFKDLITAKEIKQQRQKFNQNVSQIMGIYMRNITNFQKSLVGLQSVDGYQLENFDKQIFHEELQNIQKNHLGVTTVERGSQKSTDRIINGLLQIKSDQQNEQVIYDQEGAHSSIYRRNFRYSFVQTIYEGTYREFMPNKKQCKGKLTYKRCNKTHQPSINAFKNQIHTLKYMKDMYSPWIARYFLEVKQEWDQKDTIYMNSYKKDVHNYIKNNSNISIKNKLKMCYKIAKGLCFLHSKRILHRDFKPQNIVIDANFSPKIIDFGSSISYGILGVDPKFKVFDQRLLTTQGYNIHYLSFLPNHQIRRKFKQAQYDEHELFDVYSFGRTISYIFFGDIIPPEPDCFLADNEFQILDHIIYLINRCTSNDPDDRPGYGEMTAFLSSLIKLIKDQLPIQSQNQSTNMSA